MAALGWHLTRRRKSNREGEVEWVWQCEKKRERRSGRDGEKERGKRSEREDEKKTLGFEVVLFFLFYL